MFPCTCTCQEKDRQTEKERERKRERKREKERERKREREKSILINSVRRYRLSGRSGFESPVKSVEYMYKHICTTYTQNKIQGNK